MNKSSETGNKQQVRQVFTVAEREGKSYWIRIGAAFANRDGSETVLLDALPVNGRLQIRDRESVQKPADKEGKA